MLRLVNQQLIAICKCQPDILYIHYESVLLLVALLYHITVSSCFRATEELTRLTEWLIYKVAVCGSRAGFHCRFAKMFLVAWDWLETFIAQNVSVGFLIDSLNGTFQYDYSSSV